MKAASIYILLCLAVGTLPTALAQVRGKGSSGNTNSEQTVDVIVKYKNAQGEAKVEASSTQIKGKRLKKISSVAASIPASKLQELEQDPDIEYVEIDEIMYPHSTFTLSTPYGIEFVEGGKYSTVPPPPDSQLGACSDPTSFRIGIVDSGIYASHPGLNCGDISNAKTTRCIGMNFGVSNTEPWYAPLNPHGTHVSGTIAGLQTGVINDGKVCIVMGRVFSDDPNGSASWSSIAEAIIWLADEQHVKVISMSLGGGGYQQSAQDLLKSVYAGGALVFASAGNSGSSQLEYPASYDTVISVSAIDSSKNIASFSEHNSQVDVAAPGVDVLSTVPLTSSYALAFATTTTPSHTFEGDFMEYSPLPPDAGINGLLVDCGLGLAKCPGPGGQVCLIERGSTTFAIKAQNCIKGRGAAAIIYNNADGKIGGTLGSTSNIKIPVLDFSGQDGTTLYTSYLNQNIQVAALKGYAYFSGTSMACPHASGVASAIWRSCMDCSNAQVASCLQSSAFDLGKPGRDDYYGAGLVQENDAYACMSKLPCCIKTTPSPTTSHAPTSSPKPSAAPSPKAPTRAPSSAPSARPTGSCGASSAPCSSPSQCCSAKCNKNKCNKTKR